jgi:epoxyqueuosine reductase
MKRLGELVMTYPSRKINNPELFKSNPGFYIRKAIKDYVETSPLNCMMDFGNKPFFGEPVIAFADGDSAVFQDFKKNVSESHLLPREILEKQIPIPLKRRPGFEIKHISVISGALPINPEIIQSEANSKYGCTLIHNYLSWRGAHWGFIKSVSDFVEVLIYILGHHAVAPFFSPLFRSEPQKMADNCRKTVSNWSERHIAEACGLGTFGLNGMIITEKGVAVDLFSWVCDVELPPTPKPTQQNCLYFRNGSCGKCMERCRNSAISHEGRNPRKCHGYTTQALPEILKKEGQFERSSDVLPACGLCMTGVPCADRIP